MGISMTDKDIVRDERAADALPMRLTLAAILLLVLMLLSASAISDMLEKERIRDAEAIFATIDARAKIMAASGEGTCITLDIDMPQGVMIVLGGIYGREDSWPEDAHDHYIVAGGRKINGASTVAYSNDGMNGVAELMPGKYSIRLESARSPSDRQVFVKVYAC